MSTPRARPTLTGDPKRPSRCEARPWAGRAEGTGQPGRKGRGSPGAKHSKGRETVGVAWGRG
jgi:hypothetical protein